jgi:hypothetical protein
MSYQSPPQPVYPYPQRPPQFPQPAPKRPWYQRLFAWCRKHPIATAIIIVVLIVGGIISNLASGTSSSTPVAQVTPTVAPSQQQPTQAPTAKPTPQTIHYPPRTLDDLRGLTAKGDISAIHEFHSESVGAVGACPQPKREVTVDPSVTGQQLAEDLLAYFYGQQLDSPCGSVVFAYHNQSEAGNAYTAGRVLFDVTDSSGQVNLDPNATNLKYTLTLDTGDNITGQEYVVTY